MSERPTPETDAFITSQDYYPTGHQWRNFTRKLERERDEAREILQAVIKTGKRLESERDDARDVLDEISLYLSSGMGDENTTAQQYKERILDGVKHLAGHAWEERCKFERERDEARAERDILRLNSLGTIQLNIPVTTDWRKEIK